MGMFDRYGVGVAGGVNNLVQMYEAAQQRKLEQQRLDQNRIGIEAAAEERKARAMALQEEAQRKQRLMSAISGLTKPAQMLSPGQAAQIPIGMLGGSPIPNMPGDTRGSEMQDMRAIPGRQPGIEELLPILAQEYPEAALPLMANMSNNQERIKSAAELQSERLKSAETLNSAKLESQSALNAAKLESQASLLAERNKAQMDAVLAKLENDRQMLGQKNDAQSQALAAKLENAIEQLKIKASMRDGQDDKLDRTLVSKTLTEIPKLKGEAISQKNNIERIDTALDLVSRGVTGKGGQVKAFLAPYAELIGAKDTKNLDDSQMFQLLTRVIVGPMRLDIVGPGPVSEWEQQLMQKISGGGGASKAAATALLSTYRQMAQAKVDNYNTTLDGLTSIYPKAGEVHKPITIKQKATVSDFSSGVKAGDIKKGYRFKGGNPADKNNWEKVK